MKKLILGTALATLMAAPALAQAYNPNNGTGNVIVPTPPSWRSQTLAYDGAGNPYAPSAATLARLRGIRAQALPPTSTDPVYSYGRYDGADPDANIRFQLHRDPPGLD